MLTNETFDLIQLNAASVDSLDPNTIHNVVPLDTYIDIKTTKGLLPSATTSAVIGGYTNPAGNYNDLIPPENNERIGIKTGEASILFGKY